MAISSAPVRFHFHRERVSGTGPMDSEGVLGSPRAADAHRAGHHGANMPASQLAGAWKPELAVRRRIYYSC